MKDAGVDVVFFATPHEFSRELVPEAIAQGFRVIDLSGAWRLKQAENRKVYGFDEAQEQAWLGQLRGLRTAGTARRRDQKRGVVGESRVLFDVDHSGAGALDSRRITSMWSTASFATRSLAFPGQGRRPTAKTHFVEVDGDFCAYSVFGHRHTGEVLEQLGLGGGSLQFTPHLLPIPRGILSTIYVKLAKPVSAEELEQTLREFYAGKPWVRVFGAARLPQIKFSLNTNYCDIGFSLSPDGKRAVLVSCIDNLLKGAAGQAVQNMNLMFGFDEKEGLQ